MRRAALGLGSSLSSLGEGGLRALLLVAVVRSFDASRSSRRVFSLDVVGPPIGARTAVSHLFSRLSWVVPPCVEPPPWLPSAKHHRLLLRSSHR